MRILIAADFYPVRRTETKLRQREYEYLLGEIKPYVESADYSLVNYESTFYGNDAPIVKFGPSMATDEQSVELAQWCGFSCSTLANNHIHDYGDDGLRNLITCMKRRNMDYVGAGMNLTEAGHTLIKEINGKKVAFINCCEHEFNIASEKHGGANPLNVIQQHYAISEAKNKADYIIVIVHGGTINCQLPSPRMREYYRFFVDSGAHAVINHHQHCFSGYEFYKNAPIVYGLGNLLFDKPWLKNTTWTDGYMVVLEDKIGEGHFSLEVLPYSQCADNPRVEMKCGKDAELFFNKISELNKIIGDAELLKNEYYKWIDSHEIQCEKAFIGVKNRYLKALMNRGLFPQFKADTLKMLNYIYCESHLDRMQHYLKNKFNVQ